MTIKERTRAANRIIDAIAESGPRLLYSLAHERKARIGLDRTEQVWFVDAVTGMRLYPFPGAVWVGFTGSDKLRRIVEALALYARDGAPLDAEFIASLLDGYSEEEKDLVRKQVVLTGAVMA